MDAPLKQTDEIFCPECAKPIKKNAVICVNCGIQIKKLEIEKPTIDIDQKITPKIKALAIFLAVFLSFFTWLYTYKKNASKFWLSLGFTIVIFAINYAQYYIFTNVINFYVNSATIYNIDLNFHLAYVIVLYAIIIIFWLWAVIYSCIKPQSFYTNYPKG